MKTVIRNIVVNSLLVMGMLMATSTVSAQTRERNGRSVSGTRTQVTNSTSGSSASRGNATVSTPRKDVATSSGNTSSTRGTTVTTPRESAKVAGRNTSVSSSNTTGKVGNINRPVTNNSGNNSANHWPNDNKPTVSSNRVGGNGGTSRPADNKNVTGSPSDLRKGSNARPGTLNGPSYHVDRPEYHGSVVTRPSSWHTPVAPPVRTHRPAEFIISRPTPPKSYRPLVTAPIISGVFGLTFGYTYYNSLDYLFNRGYEIDGYDGEKVYLRNVNELNYFWPDAVLEYSSRGYLEEAELYYSTRYNDNSRFTRLFSDLCRMYGAPVSYKTSSKKMEASWYGGDFRGYISLTYRYKNGRYYTILGYGD